MPKVAQYTKGAVLFFSGDKDDRIFILQSGNVDLKSVDLVTEETRAEHLTAGAFFGVKSALARQPRMETASAVTDVQVVIISVPEFEKTLASKSTTVSAMLYNFTQSLREYQMVLEKLLNNDIPLNSPREVGMFGIAQTLFDHERYYSAMNQCEKILRDVPTASNKDDVTALLGQARVKASAEAMEELSSSRSSGAADETEVRTLKQFSTPVFDKFKKKFNKGEILISEFTKTKSFYILQSGIVSVEKYVNGELKNYGSVHPGDFFGEMEVISDSDRRASCIAETDITCLKFSKEYFDSIVTKSPVASMLLMRLICKRIYAQRENIKLLCIKEPAARIAAILLMYVDMQGAKGADEDDMKRKVYITIDDVAQWSSLGSDETRDELNKFSSRNKLAIYDEYMLIANIMDMKRTVDSYYANKDDAKDSASKK